MKRRTALADRYGMRSACGLHFQDDAALPFLAPVAVYKADRAEGPVEDHGHPHADHAEAAQCGEQVTAAHAEDPHGENRDDHAVFYVVRRAQGVGQGEGQRPDDHAEHAVDGENDGREPGGLV